MFLGCVVDPLNPQLHREEEILEVGILRGHTTFNLEASSISTVVELPCYIASGHTRLSIQTIPSVSLVWHDPMLRHCKWERLMET